MRGGLKEGAGPKEDSGRLCERRCSFLLTDPPRESAPTVPFSLSLLSRRVVPPVVAKMSDLLKFGGEGVVVAVEGGMNKERRKALALVLEEQATLCVESEKSVAHICPCIHWNQLGLLRRRPSSAR